MQAGCIAKAQLDVGDMDVFVYTVVYGWKLRCQTSGRIITKFSGGLMASAEREPTMGVWGQCPQRGPGAEPLARGSGGEAPLKLKAFYSSAAPNWRGNLAIFRDFCVVCKVIINPKT